MPFVCFTYIQVAVAVAVAYDHALTFGREIEYIWRRSLSIVTVLYLLTRYLGDAVVIIGAYLCITDDASPNLCFRLFQVRAWGTLVYSWLTQCIMQLRIYAMYGRSRRVLVLLLAAFLSEVLAIVVIIWRTIGPTSKLVVSDEPYPGKHLCSFSGINKNFTYLFIPVLCFEVLLFILAIRFSLGNMRNTKNGHSASGLRVDSFMSILVRDSILYFFINLALCVVIMGLWRNITAMRANITIPFVMLVEIVVGTRMVINFKEHCNTRRLSSEPYMFGGVAESIRFAAVNRDTPFLDTTMKGDEETLPVKDGDSAEIIAFEELSISF